MTNHSPDFSIQGHLRRDKFASLASYIFDEFDVFNDAPYLLRTQEANAAAIISQCEELRASRGT